MFVGFKKSSTDHYITVINTPQEYHAIKFPVIITEDKTPKQKGRYVMILSPMVGPKRGRIPDKSAEILEESEVGDPLCPIFSQLMLWGLSFQHVCLKFFCTPLRLWSSASSGHGCPHPSACFPRFEGLPEVFDPGRPGVI